MKNQRRTAGLKKILTVMLCAALVFGLAACGGKKNPGGTTKTPTYQAEFDPYYLHPGLAEGSDWTTADVWYPVDSPDSLPMYLTGQHGRRGAGRGFRLPGFIDRL